MKSKILSAEEYKMLCIKYNEKQKSLVEAASIRSDVPTLENIASKLSPEALKIIASAQKIIEQSKTRTPSPIPIPIQQTEPIQQAAAEPIQQPKTQRIKRTRNRCGKCSRK